MDSPKGYKSVLKYYNSSSQEVRDFYQHLPKLIESFSFDIVISYLFSRLENAKYKIIYGGLVKIHRCESNLTNNVLKNWQNTRKDFQEKFELIFSKKLPNDLNVLIKHAEDVRDGIMHGRGADYKSMCKATVDILKYSDELNKFVKQVAGFQPFGEMRGFKGAAEVLC